MVSVPCKILITCFDVSGDHHAADLIDEARKRYPGRFQFLTIAGEKVAALQSSGEVTQIRSHVVESSIGLVEGLPYLYSSLSFFRWFKKLIKQQSIDLLLCLDGQGRNLILGKIAHQQGLKTVYFFPPQVSIYGGWNVSKMKKIFDLILCPFEQDHLCYRKKYLPSVFVGHPFGSLKPPSRHQRDQSLLQLLDGTHWKKDCLDQPLISIFPGSRFQEIDRLLPIFLKTAVAIKKKYLKINFIISCAHHKFQPKIDRAVKKHWDLELIKQQIKPTALIVVQSKWDEILKASYFVLASSGTVTLKAGLMGIPHVVCYKISFLSYWIARLLIKVKYIGMFNILSNQEVCKELINRDLTVKALFQHLDQFLSNQKKYDRLKKKLLQKSIPWRTSHTLKRVWEEILKII